MHISNKSISKVVGAAILVLSAIPFFFLLDSKYPSKKQKTTTPFKVYERKWLDTKTTEYDWLWSAKFADYKYLTGLSYASGKFTNLNISSKEDLKKECEKFKEKEEKTPDEIKDFKSKINYWCRYDAIE